MPYYVWSRGRLIGHTDLGFVYRERGIRVGWFHPNELGEKLMPAATGVAPAMNESREAGMDLLTDPDVGPAVDHERALEMELRGPNGEVIETEDIGIIDTHHLTSIANRAIEDDECVEPLDLHHERMLDADGEEWLSECEPQEPWQQPEQPPRYQIQAYLMDHDAIP